MGQESVTSVAGAAGTASAQRPRYLTIGWVLLLVLGALFLFAALSDLAADAGVGLPSDHLAAFAHVTGVSWQSLKQSSPALARYETLLEVAYAVHELVFAILFLIIAAIPLRRGRRWAWWACWVPMLANITYSLTFGQQDPKVLSYSLVADIALPILLLIQIPWIFGKWARR